MATEKYIGGGKLYLSVYDGTTYGTEIEIAQVQNVNLSISQDYAEIIDKGTGVKKIAAKTATQTKASLKYETTDVNITNVAMAMFGTQTTKSFAIGDTLPDGTVASAATTLDVVKAGTIASLEAKIRFVGVNVAGSKNPVLQIHHAYITPTGDVRDYLSDSHATMGFEAEIVKLDAVDNLFEEYLIPKV